MSGWKKTKIMITVEREGEQARKMIQVDERTHESSYYKHIEYMAKAFRVYEMDEDDQAEPQNAEALELSKKIKLVAKKKQPVAKKPESK